MSFIENIKRLPQYIALGRQVMKSYSNYSGNYGMLQTGLTGYQQNYAYTDAGAAAAAIGTPDIYARLGARVSANERLGWRIRRLSGNVPTNDDEIISTSKDAFPTHPLAQAMRRFTVDNGFTFTRAWYYSQLVTGENYASISRDDLGRPHNINWYNPVRMYWIQGSDGIQGYRYSDRWGKQYTFTAGEIIRTHQLNLVDEWVGVGVVEAALRLANIDRNHQRMIENFFVNGMVNSGIWQPTKNMPESVFDRLQRELKANQQGVNNFFRSMIAPDGFEYIVPEQPKLDSQDGAATRLTEALTRVLQVPDAVLGVNTTTAYKEHADMYDAWRENVIVPDAELMAQAINAYYIPVFDPTRQTYFEFNTDFISMRISDIEMQRREIAQIDLQNGAITIEEYRQQVGLETDNMPIAISESMLNRGRELYISGLGSQNEGRVLAGLPPIEGGDKFVDDFQGENVIGQSVGILDAPPQLPALETKATTRQASITLPLANNGDLMVLQRRVRDYLQDDTFQPIDADKFHITLLSVPTIDDTQMETLKRIVNDLELPEMALNIGSLTAFDNMGDYAVVHSIRRNNELRMLQLNLFNAAIEAGIDVNAYTQPDNYKPHITMGHTSKKPKRVTYSTKVTVNPSEIEVTSRDIAGGEWEHEYLPNEVVLRISEADELKQWRKFTTKSFDRNRDFEFTVLRGHIEHYVKSFGDTHDLELDELRFVQRGDKWGGALSRITQKAIQATRIEFEDAFEDVLNEAMEGNITKRRFGTIIRALIARWGNQAYRDGLVDGGVASGEPDEDEQNEIRTMIGEASPFVTGLANEVYDVGISEEQAAQKPLMWWNKTMRGFYDAGRLSANRNQMLEFTGDDGVKSCRACQVLKGQRHRAKDWTRRALRPGVDTKNYGCGGFQCRHILVPTTERARGKFPSQAQLDAWKAAGKSDDGTCGCGAGHGDLPDYDVQPYSMEEYDEYHATQGYTKVVLWASNLS